MNPRALRPSGFGGWYGEKQGERGDRWHRSLIDPALLRQVGGLARGTRVLELGCGNGYLARRLARRGCRVVGVDLSPELLAQARRRERADPLGVRYVRADAARVGSRVSGRFDLVLSNMALMDIAGAARAFRHVARLLSADGRFVFSISHPCFDVDRRSSWERVRKGRKLTVYRKVTGYRRLHSDRYDWSLPGGRTARTVGYHRPLSWYFDQLGRSGLVTTALREPFPRAGFPARGRTRRSDLVEVPLHLVVEARLRSGRPGRPRDGPASTSRRRYRGRRRPAPRRAGRRSSRRPRPPRTR